MAASVSFVAVELCRKPICAHTPNGGYGAQMNRYVAFLKAVNTPSRNVKMDRLRSVVESAGVANVATYIASGNVIFDADPDPGLAISIEETLETQLGFPVPVYLRTSAEVVAVADQRPYGDHEERLEISFLPTTPESAAVAALVETAVPPDRLIVIGREVYWSHISPRTESPHSEARVARLLGMPTTQRTATTVRRIADRFFR